MDVRPVFPGARSTCAYLSLRADKGDVRRLRAFLAFRFVFVELEVGYRYFLSEASGSRIRQADVNMQGGDVTLAFRF